MTPPFILDVSDHAKERIKQRQISRLKIRKCLVKGKLVSVDIRGRRIKALKCGSKVLEVG